MPRLRFYDLRTSRLPEVVGLCQADGLRLANYVNSAQRRLLLAREAGDEGWWGTWAEVAFPGVSRDAPHITCPREIARVERLNVCSYPVQLHNQFYEYLEFGNGRMPKVCRTSSRWFCTTEALTRNNVVTFASQTVSPCYIRAYTTDPVDVEAAKRVLVQGTDTANEPVYTQDVAVQVQGEFITLDSPFVQTTNQFTALTGFQKDVTYGVVQIFQVDPATGDERLLLTMQPGEKVAGYRRYYLHNLPANCCLVPSTGNQTLTVTAIVKLELIPAVVDTDYLLLQNLEAIIEECIAVRMSEMDNVEAQRLASIHHVNAIRLLNSEIAHYLGKQSPAVGFHPFGSARLENQKIGQLI